MSDSARNFGRVARLFRSRGAAMEGPSSSGGPEDLLSALPPNEFSVAELEEFRDFMVEGGSDEMADPAFKERLRRDLWWVMVSRLSAKGRTPDS